MARLNVGILGCSDMAQTMVFALRRTRGFKAYAVASKSPDEAAGFAKRNRIKKTYASCEELLSDRKIDFVYIASPISDHYEQAKLSIDHAKPVLVEPSLAVNEEQARELFALARSRNILIAEAVCTRYLPFVQTIREVLGSGVIGDPVMMSANLGYPLKGSEDMTNPYKAGGSLLPLGVYPINLASMLFGNDILRIEAACSYTSRHLDEQDNVTLIYRDGRIAVLQGSMLGVSDRRGLIAGTKGYVVIENIHSFTSMTVYDANHRRIAGYKGSSSRSGTGLEPELKAFRRALLGSYAECPEMTHSETLFILQVMDEVRKKLQVSYPFEDEKVIARTFSATRQDVDWGKGASGNREENPNAPTLQEERASEREEELSSGGTDADTESGG